MDKSKFNACVDFLQLEEVRSTANGNLRLLPVSNGKAGLWKIFQDATKTRVYYELLKMINDAPESGYYLSGGKIDSNVFIEKAHGVLAMLGITTQSVELPSYEEFSAMAAARASEVQHGYEERREERKAYHADDNNVKGWKKPIF